MFENCLLIGAILFSSHSHGNFNEKNPGLYCQTEKYVIGAYHSSLNKPSVFGAKVWQGQNFGMELGGATGYKYPITPYAAGTIRFEIQKETWIKARIIPGIKKEPWAVGVSIEKSY